MEKFNNVEKFWCNIEADSRKKGQNNIGYFLILFLGKLFFFLNNCVTIQMATNLWPFLPSIALGKTRGVPNVNN